MLDPYSVQCSDANDVVFLVTRADADEMEGSALLHCGKCGKQYHPSQGGWSHGYTVHEGMSGLRNGASAGDPLHDSCYKSVSRAQVRLICVADAQCA